MHVSNLLLRYGARLLVREWRRFVLPVLSLAITTVVLLTTLLVTASSTNLLKAQATTLLGGDVVLESVSEINVAEALTSADVVPEQVARIMEFSSSLQSDTSVTAASVQVVDASYPLYGELALQQDIYEYPSEDEIFLDVQAAESLQVEVGDEIQFGTGTFNVGAIIEADPSSLLQGFRFFPQVVMSREAFSRAAIDQELLRAEYKYALRLPELSATEREALKTLEANSNGFIQVRIATENAGGFQAGLGIVTDFLVVAVLMTVVLAAVNVYASTLFFIASERRSLAILLSLGLTRRQVVGILAIALLLALIVAGAAGIITAIAAFYSIVHFVGTQFFVVLPSPAFLEYIALTVGLVMLLAVSAFAPTVQSIFRLSPKQLLIGEDPGTSQGRGFIIIVITACTFLPVLVLSIVLLESWVRGVIAIAAITVLYVGIALVFGWLLQVLYKYRSMFPFSLRLIVSQKKADGLFGIISFTSLFVALTVLVSLVLLQVTLESYLTNDLSNTVPSTYVLDVQPSQQAEVSTRFPELELFSNVPARLISIDTLAIQEGIAAGNPDVDRELGREFNLTPRDYLLESETVVAGAWQGENSGEISVDEDFAKRANIAIGSQIVFGIQGFEVVGTVTSLRKTDSRSGLPFFYFVLSPADIEIFPSVYFGYANQSTERQDELMRYLAANMPNVTVLDTNSIAPLILSISSALLSIVFIVTLPPIIIAVLLIITMIISAYRIRRRDGGRLRAIGATKAEITKWYITETVSLTLVAAVVSYLAGGAASYFTATYFLQVSTVAWFAPFLISGLFIIIITVIVIAFWLIKSDSMPLSELLSYES